MSQKQTNFQYFINEFENIVPDYQQTFRMTISTPITTAYGIRI